MAKVSVIMPAFNVAAYIGAAIESVIGQTMPDWELLVIDDGSTDRTPAVVQAFVAVDKRVRLIRQPNQGISAARNIALRRASGEFMAILDSDDLWEPRFLEAQLAIFADAPDLDVVTGNGWFLGGPFHGRPARPWPDPRPQPTVATILEDETAVFIMSVMRRRVVDAVGGFDERLRTNEDYEFWLRAAIAGFQFRRNDTPLGQYRRREDSLSACDVRMLSGILLVFKKIRPLLAGRALELRILERQVARFERERLTAQARVALDAGEARRAAIPLSALYARTGSPRWRIASFMARHAPWLLSYAYQLRRVRPSIP